MRSISAACCLELLAVALLLHQREAQHVVLPLVDVDEPLVHAEGERGKQRALGAARELAYQSSAARSVRGEKTAMHLVVERARRRGCRLVRLGRRLSASGPVREGCQYCSTFRRSASSRTRWALFEWPKMPFSLRFVEPVHTSLRLPRCAQTRNLLWAKPPERSRGCVNDFDAAALERRLVLLALRVAVVEDLDGRAARPCRLQRGEDALVLELEKGAQELVAGAGLLDEALEALDEPARQPVEGRAVRPRSASCSGSAARTPARRPLRG